MEAGLVFDRHGSVIQWHLPANRGPAYLPDSATLWDVLWNNREELGGFAHTHPWSGEAHPSSIDLSTFAAIEAGLGKQIVWAIVTMSEVGYYEWHGPGPQDYEVMAQRRFRLSSNIIEQLRGLST